MDLPDRCRRIVAHCTLAVALACLGACVSDPEQPDLARLYAIQSGDVEPPPLIVVHGVLGGRLADAESGREAWPGSLARVAFDDYEELALEIDPWSLRPRPSRLAVTGITDKAAGRDFYGRILDTLENVGGYRRAEAGTPAVDGERRYYVFTYDWRQDNLEAVRGLDTLIEKIRADYGDPDLRVDVIAHSNGGLVTRYFVRFGVNDVMNDNELEVVYTGAGKVRRVALLGTPNLGSIASLEALLYGRKIGFRSMPAEVIASFPSAYQILPHKIREWLVDATGEPIDVDVFDVHWWRNNELSIFRPDVRERIIGRYADRAEGEKAFELFARYFEINLERGRRFSWGLTVPAEAIEQRYVVFGGSCKPTPARGVMERVDGRTEIRFRPESVARPAPGVDYERLLLEPGDGTVTKASLLARQSLDPTVQRHRWSFFPLGYAIFLCEDHAALTGNLSFQDNLLNAILSADDDPTGSD